MYSMDSEISAGCVLYRKQDGKTYFLLLHYEAGHWDFPKGHIEKGETHKHTVSREVKEETGIRKIKFVHGFQERIEYFYRREGRLVRKDVYFYLAGTNEKDVMISKEHTGFEWLPYEEALARLTYKNAKEVLEKAHAFIHKPVRR